MNAPFNHKVRTSHGISIGDIVTLEKQTMNGRVISILASRLWSNGKIPMATVVWESGSIGKHSITQLRRNNHAIE